MREALTYEQHQALLQDFATYWMYIQARHPRIGDMRPAQKELVKALLRFPRSADITWCRGSGKSLILGILGYFLAYRLGWVVIITAPVIKQSYRIMQWVHAANNIMMPSTKRLKIRVPSRVNYNNRYELDLKGKGKVVCLSGKEGANVQGEHGHVVICDEKQDVLKDVMTESFIPMLVNAHGCLWLTGIGGDPVSVGETLGRNADYRQVYPWEEHAKYDPEYADWVEWERSTMLPEQFAAHFCCKPLDISAKRLVNDIQAYNRDIDFTKAITTVGVDWGKVVDKTIATVCQQLPSGVYISEWIVATGTYDQQLDQLVAWLRNDIEYDNVVSEVNGVGDAPTDYLIKQVPKVQGFWVDANWKTRQAQRINKKTGNGTLQYNPDHDLSGVFLKDIKEVEYEMTSVRNLKTSHSDFLSSLMLGMERKQEAYL